MSSATKRKYGAEPTNTGDSKSATRADDAPPKRSRVMGPAMPPPDMIPQASDNSDDSDGDDDDDDYGPTLPPPAGASTSQNDTSASAGATASRNDADSEEENKPAKRDDWMLRPPDEVDLSSRVDPTKLRNRKFNTTPRQPGPTGPSNMWTETPEEKRKRLQDEVMGVQAPGGAEKTKKQPSESKAAMSKQVHEYNERKRNTSLYTQHQGKDEDFEKDDPSARPFDKEKDIRAPTKITHAQRRDLLNKASNFNTRFAGGNFL